MLKESLSVSSMDAKKSVVLEGRLRTLVCDAKGYLARLAMAQRVHDKMSV